MADGSRIDSQLVNAVAYLGTVTPARRFFTVEAPLPGSHTDVLSDLTFTLGAQPVTVANTTAQPESALAVFVDAALTLHIYLTGQSIFSVPITLGEPVRIKEDVYKLLRRAQWRFVVVGRWVDTSPSSCSRYALFAHMDYFASQPTADVRRALSQPRVHLKLGGNTFPFVYDQSTGTLHYTDGSVHGSFRTLVAQPDAATLQGEHTSTIGEGATAYLQADGTALLDLQLATDTPKTLLQQVRLTHASATATPFPPISVRPFAATTSVDTVTTSGSLFGGHRVTLGYNVLSFSPTDSARFGVEFASLAKFIEAFTQSTSTNGDLFNVQATYVSASE